MRILDLLHEPWAILPAKKVEIDSIYTTHLRGDKIDLKAIEARIGRPLGNQREFSVVGGKAIIPVEGVLSKRMSLLHDVSGGTSTEKMSVLFDSALEDPAIKEIILQIDSPGGAVDGTKAFADRVYASRGRKPITAYVDGLAASAAYWIASAADKAYIRDATSMVGSIGVVATHIDQSQAEAMDGIVVTEITAGKFKRIDSQHAPLTAEGKAMIQERVDALYRVFVSDVARNRGVSEDMVLSEMADGRVFIGQDAIDRGLVDGVATLDSLLTGSFLIPPALTGSTATAIQEVVQMDENTSVPEALAPENIEAAGMVKCPSCGSEFDPAKNKCEVSENPSDTDTSATQDSAKTERDRIMGVLALSVPGAETLVQELAFDGATTPDQAASAILALQKRNLAAEAASLASGAPEPVSAVDAGADNDPSKALHQRWESLHPQVKAAYKDFDTFSAAMTRTAELKAQGRVNHFKK